MKIDTKWLVNQHVVSVEGSGQLSEDDVRECISLLSSMLDESEKTLVHIVINVSQVESIPVNMQLLTDLSKPYLTHTRMGWLIMYGSQNKMIDYSSSIVSQIFKTRFRQVDTREDVISFLKYVDSSLSEMNL